MTEGKVELENQSASPEGGQSLAQSDDLLLDREWSLTRLTMGRTRTCH
jgi:hypothetical protein